MKIATNLNQNLTKQITIKLTEEQYNVILGIAKQKKRRVSEFARIAIMDYIDLLKKHDNI